MAWLPVDQSLRTHRKTLALASKLGVTAPTAVGHLVFLWLWALDNVPATGDLNGIDPQQLTSAMCFSTNKKHDANEVLEALISSGFIDRRGRARICLRIHDWEYYGGKMCEARAAHRDRMRRARARLEESRGEEKRVEKSITPCSPPKRGTARRRKNDDGPLSGKHRDKVNH